MITITKLFEFEASHKLPNYDGKCANLHGHSYKLEVTVTGDVQSDTTNPKCGMILDFGDLKSIVNKVINKYDHAYLNEFFTTPTAENMVVTIACEIMLELPSELELVKVSLWETSSSYATWTK